MALLHQDSTTCFSRSCLAVICISTNVDISQTVQHDSYMHSRHICSRELVLPGLKLSSLSSSSSSSSGFVSGGHMGPTQATHRSPPKYHPLHHIHVEKNSYTQCFNATSMWAAYQSTSYYPSTAYPFTPSTPISKCGILKYVSHLKADQYTYKVHGYFSRTRNNPKWWD